MRYLPRYRHTICLIVGLSLSGCYMKAKMITPREVNNRVIEDLRALFGEPTPKALKLTVYDAMAKAVQNNIDLRLKAHESAFAMMDTHVSSYTMLPQLMTAAGYQSRDNIYSVISPENPDTVSTTEDKVQTSFDYQISWNSLDFGLSYVQSKQKADLFFIAQERKRKVIQQLIRDTRHAFWRAWAAKQMAGELSQLRRDIEITLRNSRRASSLKLISPEKGAFFRAELWKTYKDLQNLEWSLASAEPELKALLKIAPNVHLTLVKPNKNTLLPKSFPTDLRKLHYIALHDRPELREEDYKHRISLSEITKAKLKLLPTFELNGGVNYDSNSFLLNQHWKETAFRVSWDLMRLISYAEGVKLAKQGEEVAQMRRRALTMAVIAQTTIAKQHHSHNKKIYKITRHVRDNRAQYYHHIANKKSANLEDQVSVIEAKAKWLMSKLEYFSSFAALQNTAGTLLESVGFNPLHQVTNLQAPTEELAEQIKRSLTSLPTIEPVKLPPPTNLTTQMKMTKNRTEHQAFMSHKTSTQPKKTTSKITKKALSSKLTEPVKATAQTLSVKHKKTAKYTKPSLSSKYTKNT